MCRSAPGRSPLVFEPVERRALGYGPRDGTNARSGELEPASMSGSRNATKAWIVSACRRFAVFAQPRPTLRDEPIGELLRVPSRTRARSRAGKNRCTYRSSKQAGEYDYVVAHPPSLTNFERRQLASTRKEQARRAEARREPQRPSTLEGAWLRFDRIV